MMTGDQPRLVPAPCRPAFLVAEDFQPRDQAGELAVLKEEPRARARVTFKIRSRGMSNHQDSTRHQRRDEDLEERPPQEVHADDQVPWARGERLFLEVDGDRLEWETLDTCLLAGDRERH